MGMIEGSFINTVGIVILITLMGLASVVLGLKVGIKILSQINIVLCIIFLLFIFLHWANKLYLRWSCAKFRLLCPKIIKSIHKHSRLFRFFMAKCMDSLLLFMVVCLVSICRIIYCKNILRQIDSRIFNWGCACSNFYCLYMDGCLWQCSYLSRIYRSNIS